MQPETVALKAENKRNTSHHIQAKSETTKNYQNGSSDKFSHRNIRVFGPLIYTNTKYAPRSLSHCCYWNLENTKVHLAIIIIFGIKSNYHAVLKVTKQI